MQSKLLVVVLDHVVSKHVYYQKGAFHVVFISSTDQNSEEIAELNALGFVYFHGGVFCNLCYLLYGVFSLILNYL